MRRIAFISTNERVRWGGSEYLWGAAAEELARSGAQVHVSVKDWGAPVKEVEHLRRAGCRIHVRTFPPPISQRLLRRIFREHYSWQHLKALAENADLVIVSQGGFQDGLMWMELARVGGLRYAAISQSASEQWWPDDDTGERLARCYEGACAAYFVSEANLTLARLQLATLLSAGRVIRNPFNVRYEADPLWPGDPKDELRLACVARLDAAQKGQDLLIQALDRPRWRTRNLRVILAGSGVHERALRRIVTSLKIPNIGFVGHVEDIEKFWAEHHALVLASRFEGMPLALVEAMLCARACAVTDVGGNRELVRDGVNGFLAKAPTGESVDDLLERMWQNRHRLREMGQAAARDVRQWVGPDPVADFVRQLQALVDGHPR